MPPKRSRLQTAKGNRNRSASNASSKSNENSTTNEKQVCDGCESVALAADSLHCCVCGAWLHRYCAGVPRRHYSTLASSSFTCIVCSQTENLKVQAGLRDEISVLKSELAELRVAVQILQQKSIGPVNLQTAQRRTGRPTYSEAAKVAVGPSSQRIANRNRNSTATSRPPHRQQDRRSTTGRVPVVGARRVWGAYAFCTPAVIQSAIAKLTTIEVKLQIKRKTKVLPNNKSMWWFVIHSQESVLSVLEAEWDKVHLQTNWSLERCFISGVKDPETVESLSTPQTNHRSDATSASPCNPLTTDAQTSSSDADLSMDNQAGTNSDNQNVNVNENMPPDNTSDDPSPTTTAPSAVPATVSGSSFLEVTTIAPPQ